MKGRGAFGGELEWPACHSNQNVFLNFRCRDKNDSVRMKTVIRVDRCGRTEMGSKRDGQR